MRSKALIVCILLYGLIGCVPALNSDKSFAETMQLRSVLAHQLEKNADTTNCHKNSKLAYKDYTLINNLWGESKLKRGSAHLCIYTRKDNFGWKWKVPTHAKGVIGYPSIRVGPGPWTSKAGLVNHLPKHLDSIQQLTVGYDTEIVSQHKTYNLAFDLWINASLPIQQSNISTEIMVWEDYYAFKSHGKKVDEIKTDFGTYDVMKGYMKNKTFQQDWQYYAFVRQKPRKSGEVNLKVFLDYLIQEHEPLANQYLSSIEFGNEIGDSSGFTLVKNFEVYLNHQKL